jgi:hypothetical protein
MKYNLPFYSISPEKPAAEVYHSHPQCRVGQRIELGHRVIGMGENRKECPFCFVLGKFRTTRRTDAPEPLEPATHPTVPTELVAAGLGGAALSQ